MDLIVTMDRPMRRLDISFNGKARAEVEAVFRDHGARMNEAGLREGMQVLFSDRIGDARSIVLVVAESHADAMLEDIRKVVAAYPAPKSAEWGMFITRAMERGQLVSHEAAQTQSPPQP